MQYTVYSITYLNQIIYIGHTSNITARQKQHNYAFKAGKKKEVYDYLRQHHYTSDIALNHLETFKTKTEAKRYEMYLILEDYFSLYPFLKQKVPNISDR